jgi:hypothetical protein
MSIVTDSSWGTVPLHIQPWVYIFRHTHPCCTVALHFLLCTVPIYSAVNLQVLTHTSILYHHVRFFVVNFTYSFSACICSNTHIHAAPSRYVFCCVLYVFTQPWVHMFQHTQPCCAVTLRFLLCVVRIYSAVSLHVLTHTSMLYHHATISVVYFTHLFSTCTCSRYVFCCVLYAFI